MRVDGIKWEPLALIRKYSPDQTEWVRSKTGLLEPEGVDFEALGVTPEDGVLEIKGNELVNNGLTRITSLITAGGGGALTNSGGFLAVGDSSTAHAASQTDLQAASNKYYMTMTATYPQTSTGTITARASYASGVANFAWNEWALGCVNSGSAAAATTLAGTGTSPIILNRKVATMGTKASGATWDFTVTVTLS